MKDKDRAALVSAYAQLNDARRTVATRMDGLPNTRQSILENVVDAIEILGTVLGLEPAQQKAPRFFEAEARGDEPGTPPPGEGNE